MKKALLLLGVAAGVLAFAKTGTTETVRAEGDAEHSALEETCPNSGESCVRLDTVIVEGDG